MRDTLEAVPVVHADDMGRCGWGCANVLDFAAAHCIVIQALRTGLG